jgi:hypothetical protein
MIGYKPHLKDLIMRAGMNICFLSKLEGGTSSDKAEKEVWSLMFRVNIGSTS